MIIDALPTPLQEAARQIAQILHDSDLGMFAIRRLLSALMEGTHPWTTNREKHLGSGHARGSITFKDGVLKLRPGADGHTCVYDGRWSCSRQCFEESVDAWPGFADGFEYAYDEIFRELGHPNRLIERTEQLSAFSEWLDERNDRLGQRELALMKRERLAVPRDRDDRPPPPLQGIRGLRRLEMDPSPRVYFLVSGDEPVYVGQSMKNWPGRIIDHISSAKEFTAVWSIPVAASRINRIERQWIDLLQPRYNIVGTKRGKLILGQHMNAPEAQKGEHGSI